jgi:SlyX protein
MLRAWDFDNGRTVIQSREVGRRERRFETTVRRSTIAHDRETKPPTMNTEQRLTEVEIKLSYTEDLLDELNLMVYRQQQQIDALVEQVKLLRQQAPEPGGTQRNPQDELPPHY